MKVYILNCKDYPIHVLLLILGSLSGLCINLPEITEYSSLCKSSNPKQNPTDTEIYGLLKVMAKSERSQ